VAANQVPQQIDKVPPSAKKASQVYQNVKVLGDISEDEFTRLMAAITEWVSPDEGCTYCHNVENLADDKLYTKVVARRMLQMTKAINTDWKAHVAQTGVTCYTCHRGKPVPANLWFEQPQETRTSGMLGYRAGQNAPSKTVGLTSLPNDPFSGVLDGKGAIRVVGTNALPTGQGPSIKDAEASYGLMMHLSQALGVNCTFCHNSRNFSSWDSSTTQRVTAWHGLQMVRAINGSYLVPLQASFPANRLGPTGDAPKLNCATCHQGVNKPLNGAAMLSNFPELNAVKLTP
jgi:photosynthetic reaction center cytochrome c subunit